MSVYIPGMEMPKECDALLHIRKDGRAVLYPFNGADEPHEFTAIPVPPHGRLGDLDKLERGLRHMAKYQHGERQQGILGCCETIRLAPTVIEAQEGET